MTPVETRTNVESYDVHEGNIRLPEIEKAPYLDVVSALNDSGDKLTLFCVNRHLSRDLAARVRVGGFAAAHAARIQTLSGSSIYQVNDEIRPEAVRPIESAIDVQEQEFTYTFPRSSVTLIELHAK